jgi:hypothetical protein
VATPNPMGAEEYVQVRWQQRLVGEHCVVVIYWASCLCDVCWKAAVKGCERWKSMCSRGRSRVMFCVAGDSEPHWGWGSMCR